MSVTTIRQHRPVPALPPAQFKPSHVKEELPPAVDAPASAMALRDWLLQSLLQEALGRGPTGDVAASAERLERALDLAEREIYGLLAEIDVPPSGSDAESLREPLTESETRVLRYLPSDLSKREIADELYVSVNTVKTHVKHIYAKLDVATRRQAVERSRALGLLSCGSRTKLGARLALAA